LTVAGDWQAGKEVATSGALAVHQACAEVTRAFDDITRRAQGRWEQRDWAGMQADTVERLGLTPRLINQAVEQLGTLLGPQRDDHEFWRATHDAYARLIRGTANPEVAQTFFNSVSRRLLGTVGLAEDIDFFTSEPSGSSPSAT
jgi:isocitrate dehydrogenase kinase/phosphatase